MTFDKAWFKRYQSILLWCCNSSLTFFWFRRVLDLNSIEWYRDVIEITPNYYKWRVGKYVRIDIRAADTFARRCYRAFKPIWYILHVWDWLSSPVPAWNLGFDSLTVNPVGGANSPCDGEIVCQQIGAGVDADTSFANLRAGTATTLVPDVTVTSEAASISSSNQNNSGQFNTLTKAYVNFTVSAMGELAKVVDATFSLRGNAKTNGLGSPDLNVTKSRAASSATLVGSDYTLFDDTVFGSATYASWDVNNYNDMVLNAAGIAAIETANAGSGVMQFCVRLNWDVNNSFGGVWANNSSSRLGWLAADSAGPYPKLVITYLPLLTGTLTATLDAVTFSGSDSFLAWGTVYQKEIEDWVRIRTHTQGEDRLTEQMFIDWTNLAVQSLVPKIGRNQFYITTSSLGTGTSFSLSSLKLRGIEKVVDATNGLITPVDPKDFERISSLSTILSNSAYWVQEGETLRIVYGSGLTGGTVTLYYWRVPNLIDSRSDSLDIENSYVGHVTEYVVKQVEEWKRNAISG